MATLGSLIRLLTRFKWLAPYFHGSTVERFTAYPRVSYLILKLISDALSGALTGLFSLGNSSHVQNDLAKGSANPPWIRSLPHVIVAALSSFLFGYHLGVVNDTLESISLDLHFHGNTMAEGLVVSTCLGGAFLGSTVSGWIADGVGRRRTFQLCAIPLIIGASIRLKRGLVKAYGCEHKSILEHFDAHDKRLKDGNRKKTP